MRSLLIVHILAGAVALLSGFMALYATKGATLHRRVGLVFVFAMLAMCVAGMVLAAARGGQWAGVNFRAALLTAYLVVTSLATLRPPAAGSRWLQAGGMLVALSVGLVSLAYGVDAIASGGRRDGIPAFPFFLFGIVGVIAGVGDARVMRSGALRGTRRLARHLWRMSFALLIAAMSFFLGQAKVIPEPIRIMPLLALPVLSVLVTMLYWVWRVRAGRGVRGVVPLRHGDVARAPQR